MNSNDDQNSWQRSTRSDDEKKSSKATGLTEENTKICKEIGQILSRVGDEFEQCFSSRPAVRTHSDTGLTITLIQLYTRQ